MDTYFKSPDHRQTAADAACQISVDQQLAELSTLHLQDLRVCWRKLLRTQPPQLSRPLLLRLLAYRLQARAYGDLDRETVRYLNRTARESAKRKAEHGRQNVKAPPPFHPYPQTPGSNPARSSPASSTEPCIA
ncbi:DUF2924 domain-containing protein [Microvirga sp. CF3062]|uniref:DUF2924 domain-containing protein n=1 Tax=Microvirga sp. CF3062 TaxID=3110182 RepID=UPI002E7A8895|nr:DUF2924 domain-containing protein [Microvirga sp. CF3062]MEE1657863.1 DUF2924 domain-containing protein [Microvirga sp. CF3062]